jgi:hypothetical protein
MADSQKFRLAWATFLVRIVEIDGSRFNYHIFVNFVTHLSREHEKAER